MRRWKANSVESKAKRDCSRWLLKALGFHNEHATIGFLALSSVCVCKHSIVLSYESMGQSPSHVLDRSLNLRVGDLNGHLSHQPPARVTGLKPEFALVVPHPSAQARLASVNKSSFVVERRPGRRETPTAKAPKYRRFVQDSFERCG